MLTARSTVVHLSIKDDSTGKCYIQVESASGAGLLSTNSGLDYTLDANKYPEGSICKVTRVLYHGPNIVKRYKRTDRGWEYIPAC